MCKTCRAAVVNHMTKVVHHPEFCLARIGEFHLDGFEEDERNSTSLTSTSLGLYAGSSLPLSASSITSVGEAVVVADASALLNTNESPGVEIETWMLKQPRLGPPT